MGVEIERKFLVRDDSWRVGATGTRIRQAYLVRDSLRSVRIRDQDGTVTLTIKGPGGRVRDEFEYIIAAADADGLFALCEPGSIHKTRHRIAFGGHIWEVDEFHAALEGLVIAEVELGSTDEAVTLPSWVGTEVTGDLAYTNAALSLRT